MWLIFSCLTTSETSVGYEIKTFVPFAVVITLSAFSLSATVELLFVLHYPFRQLNLSLRCQTLKNLPNGYGENAFDRSGILSLIAVLRRATAACKLCNIRIAQTACLEHLCLLMFSAENIEQVLPRTVVLLTDRLIAQSSIFLHELLALLSVTLDVLGELLDLAIILSDLFRIECYGNHLTFAFCLFTYSMNRSP